MSHGFMPECGKNFNHSNNDAVSHIALAGCTDLTCVFKFKTRHIYNPHGESP